MHSWSLKPPRCKVCDNEIEDTGHPVEHGEYTDIVATCRCGHQQTLRRFYHEKQEGAIVKVVYPRTPGYLIYVLSIAAA